MCWSPAKEMCTWNINFDDKNLNQLILIEYHKVTLTCLQKIDMIAYANIHGSHIVQELAKNSPR